MHCLIVSDPKIVMFFFKCILLGIAFISPFCCLTGDCANISERNALHAKLLNSSTYNLYVRPVENSSLPVSVRFRFAPVIHYLVQGNQELQLRGRMALIWDDHRLAWNPDDYGGLRRLDLPVNKIWQPELVLYERTPTDTDLNIQIETEVVKVLSNGTVYWYTMASTRSFCFMNVKKFPFDVQNCDITFTTWMHQENEQTFYHNDDVFINDTYKQNEAIAGEWNMTHFHHEPSYQCLYCVEDQSYITYKITLERYKPRIALVSVLVPCILVEVLTLLMLCLPAGDAEVATYGLTCVLALVVFLQMLYNLLPSTDVCNIEIYAVSSMILGTLVTIVKVLCCRMEAYFNRKSSTDNNAKKKQSTDTEKLPLLQQGIANPTYNGDAGSSGNDSDGRGGSRDGKSKIDKIAKKKQSTATENVLEDNTENKIRKVCESCFAKICFNGDGGSSGNDSDGRGGKQDGKSKIDDNAPKTQTTVTGTKGSINPTKWDKCHDYFLGIWYFIIILGCISLNIWIFISLKN